MAISLFVAAALVIAGGIYLTSHFRHRTELRLDTFELVATRERWWRHWRMSQESFVRPTYLSAAARAASGTPAGTRVLVDEYLPGVRGHHGIGRHLSQLLDLRGDVREFARWAQQHPADTERLFRLFAVRVAARGAEEAAEQLRELLIVGRANAHATFAADIDAHLR